MLKLEELREIIKMIDESSIDEFKYETDGIELKLKKHRNNKNEGVTVYQPVQPSDPQVQQSETVVEPMQQSDSNPERQLNNDGQNTRSVDYDHEIISPMVGTFYAAPSPESAPYVQVGSKVEKDTIVCILEAMKLFNEIEAEVSGEIVEILVDNGELVEYGQPLFRVKTK
ncbi:acetyl-CoA carboxylase biotin carboxyl carrier protein [Cerasibacillus quisquiliarum]|uniref:Biotin carboxyl carrier protein of acetyl-CoA carboxylase n=1 Tax=Cerasibacillus quisquiliarum TaxID=227865 RepID=A0A511UWX9_9BACI|nr:acetyl-CoA carboxylase biotin carboxyl carrier protein [Cerasibacillus quisquiliarum]MBB5145469.1 acetyl-CoA carboxylase biotin carboxyl carrier protein [Cerasibacillus quisquiliarum]GEN31136.1 biotin carboxyl carrier protein of acetyl-CoA carboxylase [Cerasibacillus quisquiliarum]